MTVYVNICEYFSRITAQTDIRDHETINQAVAGLLEEMAFTHKGGSRWVDEWTEKEYDLFPTDEYNVFNLEIASRPEFF